MKSRQSVYFFAGVTAITALALQSPPAAACNYEGYIGSICWTAISYCPDGYLLADGQSLPVRLYPALAALYGRTYGGDGSTTFNLPNLNGREPVGTGEGPGLTPMSAKNPVNGPEEVVLDSTNLPVHVHPVVISDISSVRVAAQSGAGTEKTPANNVLAAPSISSLQLYADTADALMAQGVVSANIAGPVVESSVAPPTLSQPMAVLGPQLAMRACVNWSGLYPVNPN